MYEAGKFFNIDKPEALNYLYEAEKICIEENNTDGVHKMRSLRYHLEAKIQPTPQQAIEFLKKGLTEIEKTKDKFGKAREEGHIHYLQSFIDSNLEDKIKNLLEAGELYLSDNLELQGYEAVARANQLSVYKQGISIEETQRYQKKSAEAYEKAGLKNMAHNMRGGYYGTLAVKRGIIDNKRKWFLKYSFLAIDEFKLAGNISEFNFLMGHVGLILNNHLSDQEKINNLEIVSKLLNQNRKGAGDFAKYQLFLAKANLEADMNRQREFREIALKALINFASQLEIDISDKIKRKEMIRWLNTQKPLLLTLKSDIHRLKALLITEKLARNREYFEAQKLLEEIERSFPEQQLNALFNLGMLFIEKEEFDQAIGVFNQALAIDPSNGQFKKALEYSQRLLVRGFREMKDEREIRNEFSAMYNVLDVGQVPTHIENFVSKVIRVITNRCHGFERSPKSYSKKLEPELRDEILQDLNKIFPGDATAETMVGNGKTDLRIKNPIDHNDEAIAECKWWGGVKAYIEAKKQLFGYLPPQCTYGFQITFCKQKDFNAVYEEAKNSIIQLSDYEKNSLRETTVFGGKKCLFTTKHRFDKNGQIFIHHLLFNIYSAPVGGEIPINPSI